MDATRVDRLAKLFATRATRRAALAGGAGLAAAGFGRLAAQEATPDAAPGAGTSAVTSSTDSHAGADVARTEYLFTQTFASGAWAPKAGEDGVFTLTLSGAAAETIHFTDRPERIVGSAPTQQFLDGLGFTPANPPNAALVASSEGSGQDVLVIELLNPAYDGGASTLTYDARVLADYAGEGLGNLARQQSDFDLSESFGAGALFIDDCSDGEAVCYGIRGTEQDFGSIQVGECFSLSPYGCNPCDSNGQSAHYGRLCAQAFPQNCQYGPTADGTGVQWDCYARV